MTTFLTLMINISFFIALSVSVLCIIWSIHKNEYMIDFDAFKQVNQQINSCRNIGLIFVLIYWFVVSGLSATECLLGYMKLSSICFIWGCLWIVLGFACIVANIAKGILKKGYDVRVVDAIRNFGFISSGILLIISFILR